MKKLIIVSALMLTGFFTTQSFAQSIEIERSTTEYDDDQRPSIRVSLEPATKDVRDAFTDFLKDNYDVKMKGDGLFSNKDVLYAEKVRINAISKKNLDFYAKIVEGGHGTEMNVFASYGYDIYVNPDDYTSGYNEMEDIVYDFLKSYLPNHYGGQISDARDKVEDLRKDKEDMNEDIAKNKEDIEKMKKEIEELAAENEQLNKDLEDTRGKLTKAETTLQEREATLNTIKSKIGETDKDK